MSDTSKSNEHPVPHDFTAAAAFLRSLIASRKLLKNTLESSAVSAAFDIAGKSAGTGTDQERLEAVSILGKDDCTACGR